MKDRTASIAGHRAVREQLAAGERVRAAVSLQLEGTTSAALNAGTRAATGIHVADMRDGELADSKRTVAEQLGIRGHSFFLVLTDRRLLLLRRSAFGRIKEITFEVAVGDVADLRISKQGGRVVVDLAGGRQLRLETPKAFKFLPAVYHQLPETFAAVAGR